jgi:hypothetical protein
MVVRGGSWRIGGDWWRRSDFVDYCGDYCGDYFWICLAGLHCVRGLDCLGDYEGYSPGCLGLTLVVIVDELITEDVQK